MTGQLFLQAVTKFFLGMILVGLLIFLPAGTIFFLNGWLLLGILLVPMLFAGVVMMLKNPELLKKRLKVKEEQKEQKIVVALSGVIFSIGFILAGFTFRFNWYMLPKGVVLVSSVIFLVAYLLYAEVLRENQYISRTIEVSDGQKVIDTGLYGIVRHPMYSVTLFLFLSMPLILGSIYSFFVFLGYPFIIVKRIKNEERFLESNLYGYCEYKKKVKYRLIPFIW